MQIAAIVLAAGLSRRSGKKNKLLRLMDGKPMIVQTIDRLLHSLVDQIIVVTGHQSSQVERVIPSAAKLHVVFNSQYETGINRSIAAGASALESGIAGCLICLGDMPFLEPEDYDLVIETLKGKLLEGGKCIIRPRFGNIPGHPVGFSSHFFEDLQALPASDDGARSILTKHMYAVTDMMVSSRRFVYDVDV